MTSRNFGLFRTPSIVTLFSTMALVLLSQSPLTRHLWTTPAKILFLTVRVIIIISYIRLDLQNLQ